MKKITDLLENQVEWIALGLSLLFVAYSAWAYLLQPPITVSLDGGPPRFPGQIDREIREGPVADLESRLGAATNVTVPAPPPELELPLPHPVVCSAVINSNRSSPALIRCLPRRCAK